MNFISYKVKKQYSIFNTQKRENMAKVIKIVYIMNIFSFLFLVAMNVDGMPFYHDKFFVVTCYKNILANFNKICLFSFSLQR
jgi:hypothetical protein